MIMTRYRLLHKGLTSAEEAGHLCIKIFEASAKKQPNLGYADVKLVF